MKGIIRVRGGFFEERWREVVGRVVFEVRGSV
jgi:hypothetical protein